MLMRSATDYIDLWAAVDASCFLRKCIYFLFTFIARRFSLALVHLILALAVCLFKAIHNKLLLLFIFTLCDDDPAKKR